MYDPAELARHRATAPDVKESFECGREECTEMPNIWLPEAVLPGFKEACLDFFWVCPAKIPLFSSSERRARWTQVCYEVELLVLRALALGLNLPEDFFLRYHTIPDNQLRLLHYPRFYCVPSLPESP